MSRTWSYLYVNVAAFQDLQGSNAPTSHLIRLLFCFTCDREGGSHSARCGGTSHNHVRRDREALS